MNQRGLWRHLVGVIGVFAAVSAAADVSVESSDECDVALDACNHAVYLPNSQGTYLDAVSLLAVTNTAEVLLFAYNNTTNWVRTGDSTGPRPVLRIVEMTKSGPSDPVSSWTDTESVKYLACSTNEGLTGWVGNRLAGYRAELLLTNAVATTTNVLAYFDFTCCTNLGDSVAVSSDEEAIAVDTRSHLHYLDDAAGSHTNVYRLLPVTQSTVDFFALAYNNTTNWVRGGASGDPLPGIRIVEMDARGTPTLVTNWTDTIAFTNLAYSAFEGTDPWTSDRQAFYRAELQVGNVTTNTVYLDFSGCADPGIWKTLSCFSKDRAAFLLHHETDPESYWIEAVLRDGDGNTIDPANYYLTYTAADVHPGATINVRIDGTNAWGGAALFANVGLFSCYVVASNGYANASFDTRRHQVYVDDASGSHTNLLRLLVITNSIAEVIDFAYNNTTNWVRGGTSTVDRASVHVVEMNAHGTPANPVLWTDTYCETNFPGLSTTTWEETQFLTSDRKAYYRTELTVGGATNAVVYFDFGACTNAAIKNTVSTFVPGQVRVSLYPGAEGTWIKTGWVKDGTGDGAHELTAGVDYAFLSGDPLPILLQGLGTGWGGRYLITEASYGIVVVAYGRGNGAFDTRRLRVRTRPDASTANPVYHWCRTNTVDELLPFAYDTDWVTDATAVPSVTVAPWVYATLDEGRRDQVAANVTRGTNDWDVAYRGYYEARITSQTPEGVVTNTVDIDLGTEPKLDPYPGIDVILADGTTNNWLTIWKALAEARASAVEVESLNLRVDRREDLVLAANDDIVFDGGPYTLTGAISVPSDAEAFLEIIGGTYTTNPEQPGADYVPLGFQTRDNGNGTWTVSPAWEIGVTRPSDMWAWLRHDGTLRVMGEGLMKGWAAALKPTGTLPPWESYDGEITRVVAGPGVASIGSEAFSNCVNLVDVVLPGTIQRVDRSAFAEVNSKGTGKVPSGFVQVTYQPTKAGITNTVFTVEEMLMVAGKLTGGTYSYDPEHPDDGGVDEVDPYYLSYDNGNGTWTIEEAWATIGTGDDEERYRSVEAALAAAENDETVNVKRGTAYTTAATLNAAFTGKDGLVLAGPAMVDVWGTLEKGTYTGPIRISNHGSTVSTITGGSFFGPVYTLDGAIAGGTFSIRPKASQIKDGYVIVETNDEPARYKVVKMPVNGVVYPQVVGGLSYTGANQVGVVACAGTTMQAGGVTNATEVGVYTASFTPADGKCWPEGTAETVTLKWGIAPALPGVKTAYDPDLGTEPNKGGWRITLTNDVTGPLTIPDSFGQLVNGNVVLDLNGFTLKGADGKQPTATANGHPGLVISHTLDYTGAALDLTIEGPGRIFGGNGADGVPTSAAGGDGAQPIVVADGASTTAELPKEDTTKGAITKTPGADGDDYVPGPGEPTDLLRTYVKSHDEYLALSIPYAHTNDATGAHAPTLDSILRKTDLAPGDTAYIHDRTNKQIAKYVLDEQKAWQAATVVEVTVDGWTPTVGGDACTTPLDRDYGFWLRRGETSRTNEVCLWGYAFQGESVNVTLEASTKMEGDKTVRGKTLIGSPYRDPWDLNDTTRFDWTGTAVSGDWIQMDSGASVIYRYSSGKWKPYTLGTTVDPIPAGRGFWYIRAASATDEKTLTFPAAP